MPHSAKGPPPRRQGDGTIKASWLGGGDGQRDKRIWSATREQITAAYDGRVLLGTIGAPAAGFAAQTIDGRRLGTFPSRAEAFRALTVVLEPRERA
jgi:hypothetical protein